jgi:hypothetical protein
MGAAWVAGSTRARLLASRRLGRANARSVASAHSVEEAIDTLARTPYGREVHAGCTHEQAERGISQVALWHLRILAGWLPATGADTLRLLAGYWEIANVEDLLGRVAGGPGHAPYALGSLATAWPRLATARTGPDLRSILARSAWGDPGAEDAAAILTWMRLAWGMRLAQEVPEAAELAAGWLGLVIARDLFTGDGGTVARLAPRLAPVGWAWPGATSIPDLARRIAASARWVIDDISGPSELWRAEARWWTRLEADGHELVRRPRPGREVVVGAAALLAADAWRTTAALQVAARGGHPLEAYDALG